MPEEWAPLIVFTLKGPPMTSKLRSLGCDYEENYLRACGGSDGGSEMAVS